MIHRGDVVIIAQKGVYEGKPRPAVVIQSEALLADHPSISVCLIWSAASMLLASGGAARSLHRK